MPEVIKKAGVLNVEKQEGGWSVSVNRDWIVDGEGKVFRDFSLKVPFALRSRLKGVSNDLMMGVIGIVLSIGLAASLVFLKKRVGLVLLFVVVGVVGGWSFLNSGPFLVSQTEVAALGYLSILPKGKVMVFDRDCRRCSWETEYQPAALANRRDYVGEISGKLVKYNTSIFLAKDGGEGRKIISDAGVRYVYLVKYGDYIETTHFSPSDLGLEKIYENANAQIWRVN